MNEYKKLVPVVLVVMFALSVFYFFNQKADIEKYYFSTIEEARELRKQNVSIDSINKYNEALKLKKDPKIYIELAEYYLELDKKEEAVETAEKFNIDFPDEVLGYELLIKLYEKNEQYTKLFDVYNEFKYKKLASKIVEDIYNKNQYKYQIIEINNELKKPSEGLIAIKQGESWGYINKNLDVKIQGQYKYTDFFKNNRSYVISTSGEHYYIDKSGNKRHDLMNIDGIEMAGVITLDGFTAKIKDGWNVYDLNNNKISGPFQKISNIEDSVFVAENDGKTKIYHIKDNNSYDLEGEIINNEFNMPIKNHRVFTKVADNVNLYDSKGKLIANGFEDAKPFISNGAAVKKDGKWGFINLEGDLVIEYQYEDARSISNSHAAVKKDGKWGFISTKNEIIISPQFEEVSDLTDDGLILAKLDGKWNLVVLYKYNNN